MVRIRLIEVFCSKLQLSVTMESSGLQGATALQSLPNYTASLKVKVLLLTPFVTYGMLNHIKAERIFYDKALLLGGFTLEMVIWKLPAPSAEKPYGLKYWLFYGRDGIRLVGYDNERGKGDHEHIGSREIPYRFMTVEQLVADVLADAEKANRAKNK